MDRGEWAQPGLGCRGGQKPFLLPFLSGLLSGICPPKAIKLLGNAAFVWKRRGLCTSDGLKIDKTGFIINDGRLVGVRWACRLRFARLPYCPHFLFVFASKDETALAFSGRERLPDFGELSLPAPCVHTTLRSCIWDRGGHRKMMSRSSVPRPQAGSEDRRFHLK